MGLRNESNQSNYSHRYRSGSKQTFITSCAYNLFIKTRLHDSCLFHNDRLNEINQPYLKREIWRRMETPRVIYFHVHQSWDHPEIRISTDFIPIILLYRALDMKEQEFIAASERDGPIKKIPAYFYKILHVARFIEVDQPSDWKTDPWLSALLILLCWNH